MTSGLVWVSKIRNFVRIILNSHYIYRNGYTRLKIPVFITVFPSSCTISKVKTIILPAVLIERNTWEESVDKRNSISFTLRQTLVGWHNRVYCVTLRQTLVGWHNRVHRVAPHLRNILAPTYHISCQKSKRFAKKRSAKLRRLKSFFLNAEVRSSYKILITGIADIFQV